MELIKSESEISFISVWALKREIYQVRSLCWSNASSTFSEHLCNSWGISRSGVKRYCEVLPVPVPVSVSKTCVRLGCDLW